MIGLPMSVTQALSDVALPSSCRLLMWHLAGRLDLEDWRELKHESLAREARMKTVTVSWSLARLSAEGYLLERRVDRRLRAYRLPASRRHPVAA